MGLTVFTAETVPESGHPQGHDFLCSAQISAALDHAAIESGAWKQHAWDYATNIERIDLDHDARTITFKLKSET